MKKTAVLIVSLILFGFSACNNAGKAAPEQSAPAQASLDPIVEEQPIDATSGATGLGVTRVDISKEEGQKRVYAFLKESGPYFFSTIEGNRPRVRPIGIVTEHEGKIWFHVGKHKSSYKQILQNPNIEIVTINPNGAWIRVTGKAVPTDNAVVDARTFELSPGLKNIYNEKTGYTLGHFYISGGVAEISQGDTVEQILF